MHSRDDRYSEFLIDCLANPDHDPYWSELWDGKDPCPQCQAEREERAAYDGAATQELRAVDVEVEQREELPPPRSIASYATDIAATQELPVIAMADLVHARASLWASVAALASLASGDVARVCAGLDALQGVR